MKILYITSLFIGFEDILKGSLTGNGLPSFILPLKSLLESGNQVDIILVSNYHEKINISVPWINRENIVCNINYDLTKPEFKSKIINKAKSTIKLFTQTWKLLSSNTYDYVYCHGLPGYIGNIVANLKKIPCGYRLYGVWDLWEKYENSNSFACFIKSPLYYMIFKTKKKFLLITDDGSHGDLVFKKLVKNSPLYAFYFWKNGVDIYNIAENKESIDIPKHKYIFMGGRIFSGKRQDRVIQTLKYIHDMGYPLHLYFAGHISSDNMPYYHRLQGMIKNLELEGYVHFLGAIPRKNMQTLSYYAVSALFMGDLTNCGNVFYELFTSGSVVTAIDDENLSSFVDNGINGFLVEDEYFAAQKIVDLLKDELLYMKIKEAAIKKGRTILSSWEERISKEINLF